MSNGLTRNISLTERPVLPFDPQLLVQVYTELHTKPHHHRVHGLHVHVHRPCMPGDVSTS